MKAFFSGAFSLLFLPFNNICGVEIQSRPWYNTEWKSQVSADKQQQIVAGHNKWKATVNSPF